MSQEEYDAFIERHEACFEDLAADIEEESDGDDHDGLGLHSGDSNTEEDDTTAFFKL